MSIRNRGAVLGGECGVGARLGPPIVSAEAAEAFRDASTFTDNPAHGSLLRVLVADDDRDTVSSTCSLVRYWGHDVRAAHDGAEALQVAFAYRPDVLLLDLAMPGLTGCDLARRLREVKRFAETLLIAVSGWVDEKHRRLAQAAGFDQFLAKPAEPSAVAELLQLEKDRLAGLPVRSPWACEESGRRGWRLRAAIAVAPTPIWIESAIHN